MNELDLEIVFEAPACDGTVDPAEYALSLEKVAAKMTNEQLGKFVRNTLWTVTGRR